MKTCAKEHDKISYEAGDCPLCESMDLTTRLLGLVVKQQKSVIDDISLAKSTLTTMADGGVEHIDAVLALFTTAGKATK